MLKYYTHLSLATLLITCVSCAQIAGVESKRQDNYELSPSNLLVLEYVTQLDEDFLKETINRFATCGIHAESYPVIIMGNDIAISRDMVKQFILKKIDAMHAQNILEIVPARETFNHYGANKISTDYMISLENLSGDKSWVAKLKLLRTQEVISYFVNPPPSTAFAGALIDRMISDGVLTHCPAKQPQ